MALEIVAAKDLNHAFEIVSVSPRKTMKHHVVSEPEGIGGFLYDIKIVVLYKSTIVNKSKCPAAVKNRGTHVAMIYKGDDGKYYWDYQAVKKALQ